MQDQQSSNSKVSAIILAGGRGRRVGYQDKGLLNWHQKPLVSHVIDRIKNQVNDIKINCNQHQQQYQLFGYPLIADQRDNFQGPLAGIEAGLAQVDHEYCLICPCDTPNLPTSLVSKLIDALQSSDSEVAYPVCGPQRHYIPALVKTSLQSSLRKYLNNEQRSIHGWYEKLRVTQVNFDDRDKPFLNLNSKEALNNS